MPNDVSSSEESTTSHYFDASQDALDAQGDEQTAPQSPSKGLRKKRRLSTSRSPMPLSVAPTAGSSQPAKRQRNLTATPDQPAAADTSRANAAASTSQLAQQEEPEGDSSSATVSLQLEHRRLKLDLEFKNDLLRSQHQSVASIFAELTCDSCLDTMWRPFTISPCGHTFCVGCIISWFKKPTEREEDLLGPTEDPSEVATRTLNRKKSCPSCRTTVVTPPTESWLLKSIANKVFDIASTTGAALEDGVVREIEQIAKDMAGKTKEAIDKERGLDLGSGKDIFAEFFDPNAALPAIWVEENRMWHCSTCIAEVWGQDCTNCGRHFPDIDEDDANVGEADSLDHTDGGEVEDEEGAEEIGSLEDFIVDGSDEGDASSVIPDNGSVVAVDNIDEGRPVDRVNTRESATRGRSERHQQLDRRDELRREAKPSGRSGSADWLARQSSPLYSDLEHDSYDRGYGRDYRERYHTSRYYPEHDRCDRRDRYADEDAWTGFPRRRDEHAGSRHGYAERYSREPVDARRYDEYAGRYPQAYAQAPAWSSRASHEREGYREPYEREPYRQRSYEREAYRSSYEREDYRAPYEREEYRSDHYRKYAERTDALRATHESSRRQRPAIADSDDDALRHRGQRRAPLKVRRTVVPESDDDEAWHSSGGGATSNSSNTGATPTSQAEPETDAAPAEAAATDGATQTGPVQPLRRRGRGPRRLGRRKPRRKSKRTELEAAAAATAAATAAAAAGPSGSAQEPVIVTDGEGSGDAVSVSDDIDDEDDEEGDEEMSSDPQDEDDSDLTGSSQLEDVMEVTDDDAGEFTDGS